MTSPYREVVLDIEPHGPLPTQIYWRRRALALGIAVLVIGVIAAVVVMVVMNSTGTEGKTAGKPNPTQAATPTPLPGENPEIKTPVVPPAQQAPPPTPTPTAAVMPPPVLKEGDDCPDSTLAVKGITNQPQYVVGDQPKFTWSSPTSTGRMPRDVPRAGRLRVLAGQHPVVVESRLRPVERDAGKTFQPGEQVTTEVTLTGMVLRRARSPRQPIGPGTYNPLAAALSLRRCRSSLALPAAFVPAPAEGAPPAAQGARAAGR